MPTIELKPCPFCGGEAKLKRTEWITGSIESYVECTKCHASTNIFDDTEESARDAANAWNRRSPVMQGDKEGGQP